MTPPKDSSKGHMPLFALELESQAAALDFGEVVLTGEEQSLKSFRVRSLSDKPIWLTFTSDLGEQVAFQTSNENLRHAAAEPEGGLSSDDDDDEENYNNLFNLHGLVEGIRLEPHATETVVVILTPRPSEFEDAGEMRGSEKLSASYRFANADGRIFVRGELYSDDLVDGKSANKEFEPDLMRESTEVEVSILARVCRSVLRVDVRELVFASCTVGGTFARDFTVRNLSEIPLDFTITAQGPVSASVRISGNLPGSSSGPWRVEGHSHQRIRVLFTPKTHGELVGELQVENAKDSSNREVVKLRTHTLRDAAEELIIVKQAGIDFGDLLAGMVISKPLCLQNVSHGTIAAVLSSDRPEEVWFTSEQEKAATETEIKNRTDGSDRGPSQVERNLEPSEVGESKEWDGVGDSPARVRARSNDSDNSEDDGRGSHIEEIDLRPGEEKTVWVAYRPSISKDDCSPQEKGRLSERSFLVTVRAEQDDNGMRRRSRSDRWSVHSDSVAEGGSTHVVQARARTCAASFVLKQPEIDLGVVTVGETTTFSSTITSQSELPIKLEMCFRSRILRCTSAPTLSTTASEKGSGKQRYVIELPPLEARMLTFSFTPRNPNPDYRKEITFVGYGDFGKEEILRVRASNAEPGAIAQADQFGVSLTFLGVHALEACAHSSSTRSVMLGKILQSGLTGFFLRFQGSSSPMKLLFDEERAINVTIYEPTEKAGGWLGQNLSLLSESISKYSYSMNHIDGQPQERGVEDTMNPQALVEEKTTDGSSVSTEDADEDRVMSLVSVHTNITQARENGWIRPVKKIVIDANQSSCYAIVIGGKLEKEKEKPGDFEYDVVFSIESTDREPSPGRIVKIVGQSCRFSLSIAQLNIHFGSVNVNAPVTKKIEIRNQSELPYPLIIDKAATVAASSLQLKVRPSRFLRPYGKGEIEITLRPTMTGVLAEKVNILDPLDKRQSRGIKVKASIHREKRFEVQPEKIDLGPCLANQITEPAKVRILNRSKMTRRFEISSSFDARNLQDASDEVPYFLDLSFHVDQEGDVVGELKGTRETEEEIEKLEQKLKIYERKGKVAKAEKARNKIEQLRSKLFLSGPGSTDKESSGSQVSLEHQLDKGSTPDIVDYSSDDQSSGGESASEDEGDIRRGVTRRKRRNSGSGGSLSFSVNANSARVIAVIAVPRPTPDSRAVAEGTQVESSVIVHEQRNTDDATVIAIRAAVFTSVDTFETALSRQLSGSPSIPEPLQSSEPEERRHVLGSPTKRDKVGLDERDARVIERGRTAATAVRENNTPSVSSANDSRKASSLSALTCVHPSISVGDVIIDEPKEFQVQLHNGGHRSIKVVVLKDGASDNRCEITMLRTQEHMPPYHTKSMTGVFRAHVAGRVSGVVKLLDVQHLSHLAIPVTAVARPRRIVSIVGGVSEDAGRVDLDIGDIYVSASSARGLDYIAARSFELKNLANIPVEVSIRTNLALQATVFSDVSLTAPATNVLLKSGEAKTFWLALRPRLSESALISGDVRDFVGGIIVQSSPKTSGEDEKLLSPWVAQEETFRFAARVGYAVACVGQEEVELEHFTEDGGTVFRGRFTVINKSKGLPVWFCVRSPREIVAKVESPAQTIMDHRAANQMIGEERLSEIYELSADSSAEVAVELKKEVRGLREYPCFVVPIATDDVDSVGANTLVTSKEQVLLTALKPEAEYAIYSGGQPITNGVIDIGDVAVAESFDGMFVVDQGGTTRQSNTITLQVPTQRAEGLYLQCLSKTGLTLLWNPEAEYASPDIKRAQGEVSIRTDTTGYDHSMNEYQEWESLSSVHRSRRASLQFQTDEKVERTSCAWMATADPIAVEEKSTIEAAISLTPGFPLRLTAGEDKTVRAGKRLPFRGLLAIVATTVPILGEVDAITEEIPSAVRLVHVTGNYIWSCMDLLTPSVNLGTVGQRKGWASQIFSISVVNRSQRQLEVTFVASPNIFVLSKVSNKEKLNDETGAVDTDGTLSLINEQTYGKYLEETQVMIEPAGAAEITVMLNGDALRALVETKQLVGPIQWDIMLHNRHNRWNSQRVAVSAFITRKQLSITDGLIQGSTDKILLCGTVFTMKDHDDELLLMRITREDSAYDTRRAANTENGNASQVDEVVRVLVRLEMAREIMRLGIRLGVLGVGDTSATSGIQDRSDGVLSGVLTTELSPTSSAFDVTLKMETRMNFALPHPTKVFNYLQASRLEAKEAFQRAGVEEPAGLCLHLGSVSVSVDGTEEDHLPLIAPVVLPPALKLETASLKVRWPGEVVPGLKSIQDISAVRMSVTVTNQTNMAVECEASTQAAKSADLLHLNVSPRRFSLEAGESRTLELTVSDLKGRLTDRLLHQEEIPSELGEYVLTVKDTSTIDCQSEDLHYIQETMITEAVLRVRFDLKNAKRVLDTLALLAKEDATIEKRAEPYDEDGYGRLSLRGCSHVGEFVHEIDLGQRVVSNMGPAKWDLFIDSGGGTPSEYEIREVARLGAEDTLVTITPAEGRAVGGARPVSIAISPVGVGTFVFYCVIRNNSSRGDVHLLRISLDVLASSNMLITNAAPAMPMFRSGEGVDTNLPLYTVSLHAPPKPGSQSFQIYKPSSLLVVDMGIVQEGSVYRSRSFYIQNTSPYPLTFSAQVSSGDGSGQFSKGEVQLSLHHLTLRTFSDVIVAPFAAQRVVIFFRPNEGSPFLEQQKNKDSIDIQLTCRQVKDSLTVIRLVYSSIKGSFGFRPSERSELIPWANPEGASEHVAVIAAEQLTDDNRHAFSLRQVGMIVNNRDFPLRILLRNSCPLFHVFAGTAARAGAGKPLGLETEPDEIFLAPREECIVCVVPNRTFILERMRYEQYMESHLTFHRADALVEREVVMLRVGLGHLQGFLAPSLPRSTPAFRRLEIETVQICRLADSEKQQDSVRNTYSEKLISRLRLLTDEFVFHAQRAGTRGAGDGELLQLVQALFSVLLDPSATVCSRCIQELEFFVELWPGPGAENLRKLLAAAQRKAGMSPEGRDRRITDAYET